MGVDLLDGDVELTEFEAMNVQAVKAVGRGASGFPFLLMKGLAKADGDGDADDMDGPTHGAFTGTHSHPHAANGAQGEDENHSHEHSHDNDGDHGHTHAAKSADGKPAWHSPAALLVRLAKENPGQDRGALFKAVNADGIVDESPDIEGGQQAIALIARLIGYEAQELEAGCLGETWDIQLLCDAIGALRCWLSGELAAAADETGVVMASAEGDEHEALTKAKLSTAELNDLPDSAFAYIEPGHESEKANGKTPGKYRHFAIHDKAHADNAAARIAQGAKFGDKAKPKVEAAQRKFGEDTSSKSVAEGGDGVQTDPGNDSALAKALETALTKALAPHEKLIKELGDRLAKVERAPVPGGPVMTAVRVQRTEGGEDLAAKAAHFRRKAELASDPADADGYRQLAREADEKAAKAAAQPAPAS